MRSLIRKFGALSLSAGLLFTGVAFASAKPRTVELTVTKEGFVPASVKVEKDKPLKLVITRTEKRTCATEIVVPGYGIEKKLPLGETVEVTFTPKKSGELKYGCAMDQMIGGVLVVE